MGKFCTMQQCDWSTHVCNRIMFGWYLGLSHVWIYTQYVYMYVCQTGTYGIFVTPNKGDTWSLFYVLLSPSLVPRLCTSRTISWEQGCFSPEVSTNKVAFPLKWVRTRLLFPLKWVQTRSLFPPEVSTNKVAFPPWSEYEQGCFSPLKWVRTRLLFPLKWVRTRSLFPWSEYEQGCFSPSSEYKRGYFFPMKWVQIRSLMDISMFQSVLPLSALLAS